MPYVYSLAGMVNRQGGTIMRPLVMDFQNDRTAREISDQYMFGPSIMVCPVTEYKVRKRMVYFPKTPGGWYGFGEGKWRPGGTTELADAPYEAIPLFARAGTIVPMGPDIKYTDEKPAKEIEILVYSGANAKFTLYEDDGLTYAYEKDACSTIPISWDDKEKVLTVGARSGSYPGMLTKRTFRVIVLSKEKRPTLWKTDYDGRPVSLSMR
jgi:alpha-D-xyloside xylohydrolase